MKSSSLRHFDKLANPVDPSVTAILRAFDAVARSQGHDYLLVGATARHLLLVNALGLKVTRATRDVDFGIAVESWERFEEFKEALIQYPCFAIVTDLPHRLQYRDTMGNWEMPIDLIPFGGIESGERTITWPPRRDMVMNVAGFEEALRAAAFVRIDEDLTIKLASLPGLAILKVIAWSDRGQENNKDAGDLHILLSTYADAGNADRLYDDEVALLEAVDFDLELAGAHLLGRDVARICDEHGSRYVLDVLSSASFRDQLVAQMERLADPFGERAGRPSALFEQFCSGLRQHWP